MALNRLSQRLTESFKESTRDLPILQGKGPAAQAYFEYSDEKLREISQLLEGSSNKSSEADKLEGMKRLIGMISKGRDMSAFFPQVVKQVGSSSVEIRKLVYIYLLRYAESNSDLLLLSINTFQKDLTDSSPLIRGMAVRVLTSIRLSIIQGIVFLGLQKLVNDRNQWVRKTVALGLIKIYDSDSTTYTQIVPLLEMLLKTATPITIGATLEAIDAICPDNLALLHPHFRRICQLLVDADEWSQATILALMLRYVRNFLEQPKKSEKQLVENAGATASIGFAAEDEDDIDPDLALLLHCTLPLLQSRNASVVIAAVRLFYLCSPLEDLRGHLGQQAVVTPLLRLSYGAPDAEGVSSLCWEILKIVAEQRPWLLHNEIAKILVRSSDSAKIKSLKIHILTALISEENATRLVKEFKEYARYAQGSVSKDAITAIGICAEKIEAVKPLCGNILLALVKSGRDSTTAQAVVILRSLVKRSESRSAASRLVAKLCQLLPLIRGENACASVYWLGTQHAAVTIQTSDLQAYPNIAIWAPDLLRNGVNGFIAEAPLAKIEILNLAASLMAQSPGSEVISLMTRHALALARYDHDWDVRDRSRLLSGLLRGCNVNQSEALASENDMGGVILRPEQIQLVLCGPSRAPKDTEKDIEPHSYGRPIASLSSIGNRAFSGSKWDVPDWTTEPTDSTIRDTVARDDQQPEVSRSSSPSPTTVGVVGAPTPNNRRFIEPAQPPKKYKDLNDFLDESDDSEPEQVGETFLHSQDRRSDATANRNRVSRQGEQALTSDVSSDESDDTSNSEASDASSDVEDGSRTY